MSTRCPILPKSPVCAATLLAIVALSPGAIAPAAASGAKPSVSAAILQDHGRAAPEISTDELKAVLFAGSAIVFDARPKNEFAVAHIPGSVNLDETKLGRFAQTYGDLAAAMIVYSNGPFCDPARIKSDELARLGYTRVSRCQLGLPAWPRKSRATPSPTAATSAEPIRT